MTASGQLREQSFALKMALNAISKAETPKIDPHDAPVEISGGDVDAHLTPLNTVSTASDTSTRTLLLQLSRYSFSGVSIFLIITTIAAPLAYIFVFESSPPKTDLAILSTTPPVDTQLAIPAPPPQALPPMIEPQGILAGTETGAERQVRYPSLQTARRSESKPNENDLTAPPPPDLENRTSENRTTEEKGGAMPNLRPDSDAPHFHQAKESSPPKMNLATASTTAPVDTPAVTPAPLPQALLPPTAAQGLARRTEAESEVRTPSIQATRRSERRQNESEGTALQPTPDLESRTSERLLFAATSPAAVAMPPLDPLFEPVNPSIGRSPEPPQRLTRPQEPTDRIILEEPAPPIVPDLLQAVPLPRASPKPRLRPAAAAPVQTASPLPLGHDRSAQAPTTAAPAAKPKLTVVSTQAPAASAAKPPVVPAPVTTAPVVGTKPTVASVSAQPPAASSWWRKLLGNPGYQE